MSASLLDTVSQRKGCRVDTESNYAPTGRESLAGRLASTLNGAGDGPGRFNVHIDPSASVLERIAGQLASGALKLPIAATYELTDATTALADSGTKHTQGKLALRHS